MGSGPKRRKGDVVIIKPQKRTFNLSSESKGASSTTRHSGDALICPSSLRMVLANDRPLIVGTHISLRVEGKDVFVTIGEKKIKKLTHSGAKNLEKCISSGYRYEGSIVRGKDDRKYAELVRKS